MNFCPHCNEYLPVVNEVVTLCSCEAVRNIENETRQRRIVWKRERSKAMEEQAQIRQSNRRTKTK